MTVLTAITFEQEFDALMQRGLKAHIITSAQSFALADLLRRTLAPRIENEERLERVKADRAMTERRRPRRPRKPSLAPIAGSAPVHVERGNLAAVKSRITGRPEPV